MAKLAAANMKSVSAEANLEEIASANGMPPQQVLDTYRPAPSAGGNKGQVLQPGMGFGRRSLSSVCVENGLDVQAVIEGLKNAGINASAESTLKEIGEQNGKDPHSVFEAIQELPVN